MISPSESDRNIRGLMCRDGIVKIEILKPLGEQHPGFKEPAFAGLTTDTN